MHLPSDYQMRGEEPLIYATPYLCTEFCVVVITIVDAHCHNYIFVLGLRPNVVLAFGWQRWERTLSPLDISLDNLVVRSNQENVRTIGKAPDKTR